MSVPRCVASGATLARVYCLTHNKLHNGQALDAYLSRASVTKIEVTFDTWAHSRHVIDGTVFKGVGGEDGVTRTDRGRRQVVVRDRRRGVLE